MVSHLGSIRGDKYCDWFVRRDESHFDVSNLSLQWRLNRMLVPHTVLNWLSYKADATVRPHRTAVVSGTPSHSAATVYSTRRPSIA